MYTIIILQRCSKMSITRYKKQLPLIILFAILIISTGIASLFASGGTGFLLINPAGNSMSDSFIISVFTVVGVLIGSYIGGYSLFDTPLMSLIVDDDEMENGQRREGLIFGTHAF